MGAEEPPEVYHIDGGAQPGRPSRIVAPDYPPAALAQGRTGYVDIVGRVTPFRKLDDVEYRPGPESEIFVDAIKEVLRRWEFYMVPRNDCFPSDKRVTLRVWFEIESGKPRISVTVDAPASKDAKLEVIHREELAFPHKAIRAGLVAIVYARSELNPDGSVAKVDVETYPRRGMDNLPYEDEVKLALGRWTYAPAPPGMTRRRVSCQDVIFTFRD